MVTLDRIRLTGLLRKKPRQRGFSYGLDSPATRQARPVVGLTAVSVEPLGAVARRRLGGRAGYEPLRDANTNTAVCWIGPIVPRIERAARPGDPAWPPSGAWVRSRIGGLSCEPAFRWTAPHCRLFFIVSTGSSLGFHPSSCTAGLHIACTDFRVVSGLRRRLVLQVRDALEQLAHVAERLIEVREVLRRVSRLVPLVE